MLDLHGRVALIAGGGAGMGLEISRRLARLGATLALSYATSRSDAESAANALGVECSVHQADLARVADANALIASVLAEHGQLDVVVNCAGVTRFIPFEDLAAITEEVWDDILDVNVKAAFFLSRAAGTWMRDNSHGGVIVHVSSVAAFTTRGSSLPYAVAKAAEVHLTRTLAQALAPAVRVNCVAPGTVATRWWDQNQPGLERAREASLFKRLATVEDVADATVLLITNESMSGQTLAVDLGNVMH
jgi:3-oxoacyl-[acyl-carrier protein] reductase